MDRDCRLDAELLRGDGSDRRPERNGRFAVGDGDEDFDVGSTGTTHFADLIFVPSKGKTQLGVAETNCLESATSSSQRNERVLDTAGADRPWITSKGDQVWLSYHDSGNSTLIHVQYSADDGQTWTKTGDPIPGQGGATSQSTFDNDQGAIVADPTTGDVFDVYASGRQTERGLARSHGPEITPFRDVVGPHPS